jgi:hypothetical protein
MQRRPSFARVSERFIRPTAVAVVFVNLIGWSRKMQQSPSRIMFVFIGLDAIRIAPSRC